MEALAEALLPHGRPSPACMAGTKATVAPAGVCIGLLAMSHHTDALARHLRETVGQLLSLSVTESKYACTAHRAGTCANPLRTVQT